MNTDKAEQYMNESLCLFNDGFASQAGKKKALQYLTRSYECLHAMIDELILNIPKEIKTEAQQDLYWGLPCNLHQWRDKHATATTMEFPEAVAIVTMISKLVELRGAINDAEIGVVEKSAVEKQAARITQSIRELMQKREEQYMRGLALYDLFNGLPVTANVHYVTNGKGTTFTRAFYFMHGKLTSLNVLIAIMQTKHRENKAA